MSESGSEGPPSPFTENGQVRKPGWNLGETRLRSFLDGLMRKPAQTQPSGQPIPPNTKLK